MSDTPDTPEDLDGPIAPRGRAVWRLLAIVYGACTIVTLTVGGIALGGGLDDGVRVPRVERIATPRAVLRPPRGWTRTGSATFRRGPVTGTIERLAVPRRLLDTPTRVRSFLQRYLDEETHAVDGPSTPRWDLATALGSMTGYIATFNYDDASGRSMIRVDHVLVNSFVERAWIFRTRYPADSDDAAQAARIASNFPDDFTFPGIRVPVRDADS